MWCLTICCACWCDVIIGHAFWCGASLSAMHVGVVPHYRPCLLVWCLTISHACWCGASIYDMPSGVMPHYRPCLLVWCLTIGYAFWCVASLFDMPVGMVPHYRPCLLVNCHCNRHFTSQVQMEKGWLHVWCYLYRSAIISDMSADPVPLSDMPAGIVQLYQTCMLGIFIQICVFVKCCSIRQGIWSVTNPSDMPTGRVPLPNFVKLVGHYPGRHLEYIKF